MNQSSKSKLWWFAGLFVRLGCVSLLGLMLWFALVAAFGRLKILTNAPTWLTTFILLIGYTWAIHFRLPFFSSRTNFQRWLISSAFGVLSVVAGYFTIYALFALALSFGRGVEYCSPSHAADKVLFASDQEWSNDVLTSGDNGLCLFAKPQGKKMRFVAPLEHELIFCLDDFRWTKDGQVIVCSFKLLSEITTNDVPSSPVVAYDFSRHEAIVPPWLIFDNTGATTKESSWRAFEPTVAKIVAAHGGLSEKRKIYEDIWRDEKTLWFWQIPHIVSNGQ
jgi:hypothetical protein